MSTVPAVRDAALEKWDEIVRKILDTLAKEKREEREAD